MDRQVFALARGSHIWLGMMANDAAWAHLAYSGEVILYMLDDLALFGGLLAVFLGAALYALVGSQVIREERLPAPSQPRIPLYVPLALPLHSWHLPIPVSARERSARCSAAPEPSARASATQCEPTHRRQHRSPVVRSESKVTRRARPARRQRASSVQGEVTTRNLRQVGAAGKSAHQNRAKLSRFESAPTIPEREIPTIVAGMVTA